MLKASDIRQYGVETGPVIFFKTPLTGFLGMEAFMARIPDEEIERIKGEVSLVRLVESSGVELKRQGRDWHGRCPFHDDKTPSLVISEDKNLWHCLGACQIGGSVIDWTMKLQGVSFRHAVELLRERQMGVGSRETGEKVETKPLKRGTTAKLPHKKRGQIYFLLGPCSVPIPFLRIST